MLNKLNLLQAASKSNDIVTFALSPLLIIITIGDLPKAFGYIANNYAISISILVLLMVIFSFNLYSSIKKYKKPKKEKCKVKKTSKEELPKLSLNNDNSSTKKTKILIGGTLVLISMLIVVYILSISIKGLHYPIISSPTVTEAGALADEINNFVEEHNYKNLKVSVYCGGNDKEVCSIVPGGIHFTRKDANETLKKAKEVIPQYVGKGSWVQSYNVEDSVRKRIRSTLKKYFGV